MHVKHLINLRANKIHTSSLVLLSIVQDLTNKSKTAFIGEITATYSKHDPDNYSYGGVYSMLERLRDRGLLLMEKIDGYNSYTLSTKGFELVYKF